MLIRFLWVFVCVMNIGVAWGADWQTPLWLQYEGWEKCWGFCSFEGDRNSRAENYFYVTYTEVRNEAREYCLEMELSYTHRHCINRFKCNWNVTSNQIKCLSKRLIINGFLMPPLPIEPEVFIPLLQDFANGNPRHSPFGFPAFSLSAREQRALKALLAHIDYTKMTKAGWNYEKDGWYSFETVPTQYFDCIEKKDCHILAIDIPGSPYKISCMWTSRANAVHFTNLNDDLSHPSYSLESEEANTYINALKACAQGLPAVFPNNIPELPDFSKAGSALLAAILNAESHFANIKKEAPDNAH